MHIYVHLHSAFHKSIYSSFVYPVLLKLSFRKSVLNKIFVLKRNSFIRKVKMKLNYHSIKFKELCFNISKNKLKSTRYSYSILSFHDDRKVKASTYRRKGCPSVSFYHSLFYHLHLVYFCKTVTTTLVFFLQLLSAERRSLSRGVKHFYLRKHY